MRILLRDLSYRAGKKSILERISLTIDSGERCVIAGPNGSGKTTLLRLIAGLELPAAGTVSIDDRICSEGKRITVPTRSRNLSMMFQDRGLWAELTVRKHIEIGVGSCRSERERRQERVDEILEEFELSHLAKNRACDLSGGEQQRVALARCLATSPGILLLDEPFSNLDAEQIQQARRVLGNALEQRGITLVVVAHRWREIADLKPDRFLLLNRGYLFGDCSGEPEIRQLNDSFANAWIDS